MSVPIQDIATHVPNLLLRRLAQSARSDRHVPEWIAGAVLYSDISGFTALAERLARRGPAGAEELSEILNAYFGRLIAMILDHGGDILKLAGDALVAFWPASDEPLAAAALRAGQCGLAVQASLNDHSAMEGVSLLSKIGIGAGDIATLHVGGVRNRWELLIAGEPFVQIGRAEKCARPGDVIFSPEAWPHVSDVCGGTPVDGRHVRLEAVTRPLDRRPVPAPILPPPLEATLRGYVPAAILSRLDADQTGWVAELRAVTVLFINLAGLNVTTPEALDQTHAVIRSLQSTLYRHEGSFNKLGLDDKGLTLVAAMGLPPFAHSDDPARGVQTAIEIRDRLRELDVRGAIGVASGRVYCGEIGGRGRREYTVIGDKVNLAARLMQAAPGIILCDRATRQAARTRFAFEALPPVTFKGKSEPIPIFRPSGQAATSGDPSPLVGRLAERRHLHARLESLVAGSGGMVVIEGEAGIGKSRLVADLVERAEEMGITVLAGAGDAVEKSTPYFAWRPVVARLLGVEGLDDPDERRARVQERLGADPELAQQAPLLNAFLPLGFPDNELTATMDGRIRADNTHALLLRLLGEAARPRPTALVLEDTHWLDSASWALTARVRRRLPSILLVLAQRPTAESIPPDGLALLESPGSDRIPLGALEPDDVVALACNRLGVDSLPPPVAALIRRKAHGHPFFGEELAYALRDLGLIEIHDGSCLSAPGVDWDAVPLPDSIQGVITNRIDRLQPSQQLTLKISSVIGYVFPLRVLRDIFPIEPERQRLPILLDELNGLGFTLVDPSEAEVSYLFKHLTTKEVAYDMLLFSQRRQLHRSIAAWYEETFFANPSTVYPLLAYHWSRAGEADKAVNALERAGEQALRSGAYREAVSFLLEALALGDRARSWRDGPGRTSRRARWEAQLGEAYLGLGQLAESRVHTERALRMLEQPVPASPVRLVWQYAWQVVRQAAHRLRPPRLAGRSRRPAAKIRLASATYDALAQVCYYSQDVPRGVYSSLRASNLAEGVGPCPELARSGATMCIASSLIPLHRLAEAYGRRAWATAEAIDDPPTRAFVAELLGVYWLGIGNWEACREKLVEAAEIGRRIGDWRRWEESVGELARLEYLRGHFDRALDHFGELWRTARQNGHDQAQVWSRHGQSTVLLRMGRIEEAASLLEGSPTLSLDSAQTADTILGLGLLAVARLRLGKRAAARKAAEETLRQLERTRPMANFNLEGYSGAVEVLLALWDASPPVGLATSSSSPAVPAGPCGHSPGSSRSPGPATDSGGG